MDIDMTDLDTILNRSDKNGYYLQVAMSVAFGSKCPEGKQHGCIAVKHGRIVSTAYNGVPSGQSHCGECKLDEYKKNHKGRKNFSVCPAVHAEINCIITAALIGTSIVHSVFYVTKRPCEDCLKALQNMQLAGIVYMDDMTGKHWVMVGPSLRDEFVITYGGTKSAKKR
jgi:dCMP deaminase